MDLAGAGLRQGSRARGGRGPGREDVVHEQEARRRGAPGQRRERAPHRRQPFRAPVAGLGVGRADPPDEGPGGETELARERSREHASLIEPAFGPTPARERHPRHGVGRRRAERGHGAGQGRPHASPAGELQAVDRGARRTPVRERGPCGRDRPGGAIAACVDVERGGSAAPSAPRRTQRLELVGARLAERPRACAAPRAGPGEEDVHSTVEHDATVPGASDDPIS